MPTHRISTDSIYHRFFAHPEMVVDLLIGFLDPTLLAELDLDNLKRHNTKFTARRGQRRRSDIIWEIPTKHGGSIFILLVLEFQSEVDEWMPLRTIVYTGLLYQQLVAERKLKAIDGLPPVLPIILYNAEPRWNAATSLKELIRLPEGSSLWRFQPEMRYHVIDEGSYPKERLEGSPTLTAIIFRMEHPENPEALVQAAQDLTAWFKQHPDGPPVKELFRELLLAGLNRLKVGSIPAIPDDLQEVVIMLAARVEQWAKDYEWKGRQAGFQDGELKGRQEGRQEEAVSMLLKLMRRKFGSTPDWVTEKVRSADLELLGAWGENVLFANSVDEVFADQY